VAENLHLQRSAKKPGPIIFIDEAACRLNGSALRNFDLQVESILLRGGRIVWPLTETNEQTATFQLEKIGGELLIKPNDLWQLRSLTAEVLGMRMEISGSLTNASLVRDWRLPKSTKQSAEATQALWRRIVSSAAGSNSSVSRNCSPILTAMPWICADLMPTSNLSPPASNVRGATPPTPFCACAWSRPGSPIRFRQSLS
jgi:hypothetical protein